MKSLNVCTDVGLNPKLCDPSGRRLSKPRTIGKTMVIDKGLGLCAFYDLLNTAAAHMDVIKLGFGTAVLYPPDILRAKIRLARERDLEVITGGTMLEVAVCQNEVTRFFAAAKKLGFSGVEISDGTIELDRKQRNGLIRLAQEHGLKAYTEYGKKRTGFRVDEDELVETIHADAACGAVMVAIEGRESGSVGLYDETGALDRELAMRIVERVNDPALILWEAPFTAQQAALLKLLGSHINLGNIAPADVLALEALRRGLRSDTLPVKF